MEYVITTDRPFDEIESQTVEALEQQGLMVQRTFSLRSAVRADRGNMDTLDAHEQSTATGGKPGYSVLMLYAAGAQRQPLGLITLYKRGDRTVINPVLTPDNNQQALSAEARDSAAGAGPDAEAELVAALVRGGLELCVDVADSDQCIDPGMAAGEIASSTRLVQDPVCGKWLEREQSEAGIEYGGTVYYVCCPLCQDEFDSYPERYAQA